MNNTLKAYRRLLNLTQKDMATIIGKGLTSYNQKEQGKIDFTSSEMSEIINFLKTKIPNITAEEIFFTSKVHKLKTIIS